MADEQQDLDGALRGDIRLEVREDEETGERLAAGVPTAAELKTINRRFARTSLSPEDVYVLPVYISGSGLDSYGTRQDVTSLRNYKRDVTQGDAVSLLAHHGGGSFFGGSTHPDPLGRFFDAELQKLGDADADPNERSLPAYLLGEDGKRTPLGKYYKDGGYALLERAYMLRGTAPNGQDIEDTIRRIEGGVQRDTSIQFTLNPVLAPGAQYTCDICGLDLFDRRCEHIPLVRYPDPNNVDGAVLATAAIKGARQLEGSLVWRGAYPAAFVARAARLATEGRVSATDVARLEHYYGARILGSTYYSLGKGGNGMADEQTQPLGAAEDEQPTEQGQEREVELIPVIDVEVALSAVVDTPAPAAGSAEQELAAATQALEALRDLAVATAGQATQQTLRSAEDAVRLLGVLAGEAVYARRELIEACVAERVRSRGAAEWDATGYRSRLARFTMLELEDELRDLAGQTATVWSRKRQLPSQLEPRDGNEGDATERKLSPVEVYALQGA